MNKLRKKTLKGVLKRIRRRLAIYACLPAEWLVWTGTGRSTTPQEWCRVLHSAVAASSNDGGETVFPA